MNTWTVIDSENDLEVGTITYDGIMFQYDGGDFALDELVDNLNVVNADELPDALANASRGRYIAIQDEGGDDEDTGFGDDYELSESTSLEAEPDPEPQADAGWIAVVTRESRQMGTISGTQAGKLELDIQDATFQMLLMTEVVPALESADMTPARDGYAEALRRTIESIKDKGYRVEVTAVASMREATGGSQPDMPIRWGSVSPQWGGPAAPWTPVPLGPAKDFIRDHPDADIEFNFPTVFEEDRSAKVKDLLAGNASGFISHRRTSEQYAKEMGFEQYDYDTEQAEIGREKPKAALPPDMLGKNSAIGQSIGSTIGGHLGMSGPRQPVQSALADTPGRGVSRAQWATDDAAGRHAFRGDQKRLAEDDEIAEALEAWRAGR